MALSKLSVDPVNLAWGYASHARPIAAPALPPASPPHRMQTWMQTKTAIVLCISLHSCIFLASTGNHSKPPDCSFSWRHATEGLPGPRWAICAPFHDSRRARKSQLMAFWALATRFSGSYRCRFDRQTGQTGQTGQTRQTGHRGVMLLTLRGQPETGDVMYR
jgi:hypothetical protein